MKIGLWVYTFLGVCLKVFNEGSLAVGASQDVLEEVQHQVMSYLLDERLNKLEEVAQVHRYGWDDSHSLYMYSYQYNRLLHLLFNVYLCPYRTFNLIMSRMLEHSNKNYLFG